MSSAGGSFLTSQPPPPALPSWVGESQALYWAQLHLPPLRGVQGEGKWRAVPGGPHCLQWFP